MSRLVSLLFACLLFVSAHSAPSGKYKKETMKLLENVLLRMLEDQVDQAASDKYAYSVSVSGSSVMIKVQTWNECGDQNPCSFDIRVYQGSQQVTKHLQTGVHNYDPEFSVAVSGYSAGQTYAVQTCMVDSNGNSMGNVVNGIDFGIRCNCYVCSGQGKCNMNSNYVAPSRPSNSAVCHA